MGCHHLGPFLINNTDDEDIDYNQYCRVLLILAFPWEETEEGYEYWNKVYQSLEVKE